MVKFHILVLDLLALGMDMVLLGLELIFEVLVEGLVVGYEIDMSSSGLELHLELFKPRLHLIHVFLALLNFVVVQAVILLSLEVLDLVD